MANYVSKHTGAQIDQAVAAVLAGDAGGSSVSIDKTLTQEGAAADAKATGERLNQISEEIDNVVHVGEDEPTDESVKLWVDPSDEGEDSPAGVTSVNGMTGDVQLDIPSIDGLASEEYVQNALANVETKEGVYSLIETITLTEDVTPIDRSSAPDGKAYAFDNVVVMIDLPPGSYESTAYYAQIYFGSTFITLYQEATPHATYKKRAAFLFESRNGKMNAQSVAFTIVNGTGDGEYTDGATTKASSDFRFAKPIYKVRVKSNKTLPAGTVIKIYGVVK